MPAYKELDKVFGLTTMIETEVILVDQPKGAELEYRVIAVNKSGESSPINAVMVVL